MPGGTTTFLFTDIVGSSETLARLGDDAADELRRTHFGLLREAVAEAGGEEVKSLGDGLMVAFSSAFDAASCAVAIQQGVARHNRKPGGAHMQVRVGLNIGEPIRGEDDYFGSAVVVAKRLCDAAAGGQILASDLVRGIVAGRGSIAFEPLGPLELKGLAEPLAVSQIVWQRPGSSIPLSPALSARDGAPFVGRTDALDQLRSAFHEAHEGKRRLLLVAGEPGVGKTRLASEFARETFDSGATVLYGRCDEEPLTPYQPFVQALRHYVENAPERDLRSQLGNSGHELQRLIPSLNERVSDLPQVFRGEPDTERFHLFEAVADFLDSIAATATVLLVLDDLHWADLPTLLLLKHLARAERPSPVMLLGTYRDVELDRRHPLADVLADLRRESSHQRLLLRGLPEEDVVSLLEQRIDQPLDDEGRRFAAALHAETEGNPFFIREIIRHLIETGALRQEGDRWTSSLRLEEIGLPESVREVVGRRLSRLSDKCNEVLRSAAVIGRDFELGLLGKIVAAQSEELLDSVEQAVAARVIEETVGFDHYTFSHAIVRDTLYSELTTSKRVRLHQRIGEELERTSADRDDERLGELAFHFWEAAPLGDIERATRYAMAAGDRAYALVAYEEAATHYERGLQALELMEEADPFARCDLLIARGKALAGTEDLAGARAVFLRAADLARRIDDPDYFARATLGYGGLWVEIGLVDQDLIRLLEEAVARFGDASSPLKARVLGRFAMELAFSPDNGRAKDLSEEAVSLARAAADEATLAYVLLARRHSVTGPTRLDERIRITREAVALADAAGEKEMALRIRGFLLIDAAEAGDRELFWQHHRLLLRAAEELRQPRYRYLAEFQQALVALLGGRFQEAAERARMAREYATRLGRVTGIAASTVQLFVAEWERGELASIEDLIRQSAEQFGSLIPEWRTVLPVLHLEGGRLDEARAALASIAEDFLVDPRDDWTFWIRCGSPAFACTLLEDRTVAARLYELLRPYEGRHLVSGGTALVTYDGPVSLALGMLAGVLDHLDVAERHFKEAISAAETMEAPSFIARARYEYSRILLKRGAGGDRELGTQLLERATRDFERLGMASMLKRARTVRALGE